MKLLKNAKILSEDCLSVFAGSVLLDGNVINGVIRDDESETSSEFTNVNAAITEVIDCNGNLLLPSFVNMHTHSGMTFLRSRADDLPLQKWLENEVFPFEAKLTLEDQYWFMKLAILEYLKGGVSAIFDMYLHNEASANVAKDMMFRTTICGSVNDFGGSTEDLHNDYIKYNTNDNEFINFKLGFHAGYTTSRGLLLDIALLSNELKAGVWTHCSENSEEVQGCIDATGTTPFKHFEDLGLWNNGGGAFHSTHLTTEDLQVIKRNNLLPITCPSSNLKLASGVAPLQSFVNNNIHFGIGTDGPASNNQLSMFREMYLASVLQKNLLGDPTLLPPHILLKSATQNGAKALGLNGGTIMKGKLADLVLLNLNSPNTLLNAPLKNVVYSMDTSNVIMTIVGGEVRYREGEFHLPNGESVDQIYHECKTRMSRIFR